MQPTSFDFFFSEKEEKKLFSPPPKQHIWRLGEKERSTTPLTVMSDKVDEHGTAKALKRYSF